MALTPDRHITAEEHIERMLATIARHRARNSLKWDYYRLHKEMQDLRIAIPPGLPRLIRAVVGWPGTVVDVIDERLEWAGWASATGDAPYDLDAALDDNILSIVSPCLDALVTGVTFGVVGKGAKGEPDVLITLESSDRATLEIDPRTWRPRRGLVVTGSQAEENLKGEAVVGVTSVTFYDQDATSWWGRSGSGGRWVQQHRVEHRFGRPTMVRWVNQPAVRYPNGRSEISRDVIYYSQHGMRTLATAEVARDMFAAPQRWLSGVDEEKYKELSQWQAYMGRFFALTASGDGTEPKMGQFDGVAPGQFFEPLEPIVALLSSKTGIPVSYFGTQSANPPSADAARVDDHRLNLRTRRRRRGMDLGYRDLAAAILLVRDGEIPDDLNRTLRSRWEDTAPPTPASAADATAKLVGSGILPPTSPVTLARAGLDRDEIEQIQPGLEAEARRGRIAELADAARAARTDPDVTETADARRDPLEGQQP